MKLNPTEKNLGNMDSTLIQEYENNWLNNKLIVSF